ncbi:MAG: class I SAM-dependent methyltransferase, partial [Isosphaeraceae bacterium]
SGPVLDIACGTGRILLPCLQAGVDIEGLDLFEPMLKTLRAKAAFLSLLPRLHQADMSDFSLSRCYRLVMTMRFCAVRSSTSSTALRFLSPAWRSAA